MFEWPKFSLIKVQIEGKGEYFLLIKAEAGNKDFPAMSLEITDGMKSFRGSVSSKEMKTYLKDSRLDRDVFVKLTMGALTNIKTDEDAKHFSYSLQETRPDHWTLTWKKYIPLEDIKFQLGSVELQSTACTVAAFLDGATHRIDSLEDQVDLLEAGKSGLQSEKEKLVATLRDKVYEKSELERKLMSKFVLVLNTKKAKIRELKSEIKSLKENHSKSEDDDKTDSEIELESVKKRMGSRKKSQLDSSLKFVDDLNVPSTSKQARRVCPAKITHSSTPPISKRKCPSNRKKESSPGNISDLECDTLELMDNM